MKHLFFGDSQSKWMLEQEVESLKKKIRIVTESNKSLNAKWERTDGMLRNREIKLENKKKEIEELEEDVKERKEEKSRILSQLRAEREDHARKLQETTKIIEEEMNKKFEDAMDKEKHLYELTKLESLVLAEKLDAYKYAYNEVVFLLRDIIGDRGKLAELEDEGASWVSDYRHEFLGYMKDIRDDLKAKYKKADSQEIPKRKEPEFNEAKPVKPKVNPAPPHPPTEAESEMGLKEGYTYYDVLAVPQSASFEDIKKAYKKQALAWHPNQQFVRNKSGEVMEEAFKLVSEAYEVLKDEKLRKVYNAYLQENSHKTFRPGMFFPGFKFSDPYKTFARFGKSR